MYIVYYLRYTTCDICDAISKGGSIIRTVRYAIDHTNTTAVLRTTVGSGGGADKIFSRKSTKNDVT